MRNLPWTTAYAAIISVLLIGCSTNASSGQESDLLRNLSEKVVPLIIITKEMQITNRWGPHSKVNESMFTQDNVHVGMKFAKFESILISQGFSSELGVTANHYGGKNEDCKQQYGTYYYSFYKVEIIDGKSLLKNVEAIKCDSEEDYKIGLLENEPTLEIYELYNAKNK